MSLYHLFHFFGGNPHNLGSYVKLLCAHIYATLYHFISDDSLQMYREQVDIYRRSIHAKLISEPIREDILW